MGLPQGQSGGVTSSRDRPGRPVRVGSVRAVGSGPHANPAGPPPNHRPAARITRGRSRRRQPCGRCGRQPRHTLRTRGRRERHRADEPGTGALERGAARGDRSRRWSARRRRRGRAAAPAAVTADRPAPARDLRGCARAAARRGRPGRARADRTSTGARRAADPRARARPRPRPRARRRGCRPVVDAPRPSTDRRRRAAARHPDRRPVPRPRRRARLRTGVSRSSRPRSFHAITARRT